MTDFETLKTKLADSAARSDIEMLCQRLGNNWDDWYETAPTKATSDEDEAMEQRTIDDAIAYLTARCLIETSEANSHLIRFKEPPWDVSS